MYREVAKSQIRIIMSKLTVREILTIFVELLNELNDNYHNFHYSLIAKKLERIIQGKDIDDR